jgi:dolichol-phosphate mannosyltransferase
MRFLLALPVYNEERYIERVLRCTRHFADDIVVVNDGSTDSSAAKARAMGVDVIDHPTNLGYGRTLRDAFAYAAGRGFDVVITMDADMQHLPRYIPAFLWAIPDYDIVSGSRYLQAQPDDTRAPEERRRVNRIVTEILNARTGYNLTDSFCGFKAYKVESLRRLDLREDGYAMPLELWIEAAAHGLTVKEIPVSLVYVDPTRTFGNVLDDAEERLAYYKRVIERESVRAGLEDRVRLVRRTADAADETGPR